MAPKVTFSIGADKSEFSANLRQAREELKGLDRQELSGLKKQLSGIGASVKGLFAIELGGLLVRGVGAAKNVLTDLYQTGAKIESIWASLGATMANQGMNLEDYREQIAEFASAMQELKKVDDDEIVQVLDVLMAYGYNLRDAYRQVPLVLDMAARRGKSLTQAAMDLGKAYVGMIEGAREYGVAAVSTGDKVRDTQNAIEQLTRIVRGSHDAMLEANPATALSVEFGNLKDDLGLAVFPVLNEQIREFTEQLRSIDPQVIRDFAKEGGEALRDLAGTMKFVGESLKNMRATAQVVGRAGSPWLDKAKAATYLQLENAATGFDLLAFPMTKMLGEDSNNIFSNFTRMRKGWRQRAGELMEQSRQGPSAEELLALYPQSSLMANPDVPRTSAPARPAPTAPAQIAQGPLTTVNPHVAAAQAQKGGDSRQKTLQRMAADAERHNQGVRQQQGMSINLHVMDSSGSAHQIEASAGI